MDQDGATMRQDGTKIPLPICSFQRHLFGECLERLKDRARMTAYPSIALPDDLEKLSKWEAMGDNGRQWEAMGSNGRQWEAMGGNGRQWAVRG